jgi:hypothetical protein
MTTFRPLFTALCLFTSAPLIAAPSLQFVDHFDGSVTLQIVSDDVGSLGAELAVSLEASPGLSITNAIVNTAVFDTANPGDNPFIPGLPVGGDTTGLFTDFGAGQVFAAFGSGIVGTGNFDYLTLEYEGSGTLNTFGVVAQRGVVHDVSAMIDVNSVPEPTGATLVAIGVAIFAFFRRWQSLGFTSA